MESLAGTPRSFRPYPRCLDDRPPLFDPGPVQGGERLRRLLLAWENLLAEIGEPCAHGRIGQGIHDRGIEPRDDGRRRALGAKNPCQFST